MISNDFSFVFFTLVGVSILTAFTGVIGAGFSSALALKNVNFLNGLTGEYWFFFTRENCC